MTIKEMTIYFCDGKLVCYGINQTAGIVVVDECGVINSDTQEPLLYIKQNGMVRIFYGRPFSYKIAEEDFGSWIRGEIQ
jgi:hypothetical protein